MLEQRGLRRADLHDAMGGKARVSEFFAGKNWDDNDPDPDHGMVLHLKVGEQGHYHFQSLSAPFAIAPGEEVDQHAVARDGALAFPGAWLLRHSADLGTGSAGVLLALLALGTLKLR